MTTLRNNIEKLSELNTSLEQTLYGTNTGGKSYYDEFWDTYQDYGNRTNYAFSFGGSGWTAETFKPKYDIISGSTDLIYAFARSLDRVDLAQHLNDLGIVFNVDKCQNFNAAFVYCKFTRCPELNTSSAIVMTNMFRQCLNLKTIDKLILRDDGKQTWQDSFHECKALENIAFEGVIGTNIAFATTSNYSPLNKDSLRGKEATQEQVDAGKNLLTIGGKTYYGGIIAALSDTAGATLTLSKAAVDKAFETAEGLADGSTSDEWIETISDKSNKYDGLWSIDLI